jgi:carbamoyltransferase
MTAPKLDKLFGGKPRDLGKEPLTQRHMYLAASVQKVTEEVMLRMTRELARTYAMPNLCLAGGVALNCVADGKIRRLWMQPAAGDERHLNGAAPARLDGMQGSYLGPAYAQAKMERRLSAAGARFDVFGDEPLLARTVDALAAGAAVGWFQGRMEFGPRSLGRTLDSRRPAQSRNAEDAQSPHQAPRELPPFAPAVLDEDVAEYLSAHRRMLVQGGIDLSIFLFSALKCHASEANCRKCQIEQPDLDSGRL